MEKRMSKNYAVSEEVLTNTLVYLSTRPYREVSELINLLRSSQELKGASDEASKLSDSSNGAEALSNGKAA
jgi:hypothetical protein